MRCALLIVFVALAAEARGEPGPTPPIALGSMEVPYPDGASGDAEVTLELVVEVDGTVSSGVAGAVEALPGVVPLVSGFPYFFIRGAPPNDNGYFVDGIRVPFLFHIGIGQAVIHPGVIDRVDFFPGAAPAAYGGVAGAIIAGQMKE